jgi:hypothetical protein
VQPVIEDMQYMKYLFNIAVLSIQTEYSIKYDTAFWTDFKYKEIVADDIYYLLNREFKMYNSEWGLPKSEFKHCFFELYEKGKPKSKAIKNQKNQKNQAYSYA